MVQKQDTILERIQEQKQDQTAFRNTIEGQISSLYGRVGLTESNVKVVTSRINNYFKTDQ